MTEQTPINQNAAEQRLVEELTGSPEAPRSPREDEHLEPGDPVATPSRDEEQAATDDA